MNDDRRPYPTDKRGRWRRIVFIAGPAAIVVIAIVARLLMMRGR